MTVFGNASRAAGGSLRRFASTAQHPPHADRRAAALRPDHAAMSENRTLFPSSVVAASDAPRLLVSGKNQAKIGGRIMKGPWAGLAVYCLTLEERATCPASCDLLDACYGNALPFARRHRDDGRMIDLLDAEISTLLRLHPSGIAVRLHILGDFYSAVYARAWLGWVRAHPQLHVFGFTAWQHGTEIGDIVLGANRLRDGRWKIRCSVEPGVSIRPMQATTIWRQPEAANVPEGLVCPASTHKTDCCSTCALCWSHNAASKRIVFVGHGMKGGRHKSAEVAPLTAVQRRITFAGGANAVATGMGFGAQAILRWGKTDRVPQASREAFDALCDDLGQRRTGGSSPMKFGSDKATRQCESLGVVADEVTFRAAVADIAWSKEHSSDQRAAFLHPDPGSRETWRVMLGGVEVDVLFQPSSNCVLDVSMVRGYAKASAKAAPRALNALAAVDYAPKPPVHAPSPAPMAARAIPANAWDWTPARDALLRDLWPSQESRPVVEKRLRALPGQSGSTAAIATRAIQTLKLQRPPELSSPYHGHAVRETKAQREARIVKRDEIIRLGYMANLQDDAILLKLNEADKGPWGGRLLLHDIGPLARTLGFKRSVLEPAIAASAPMPVEMPEPPQPAPQVLLEAAQLAEVSAEVVEIAAATAEAGDSADASDSTDATPSAIFAPDLQIAATAGIGIAPDPVRGPFPGTAPAAVSIFSPSDEVAKMDMPIPEAKKNGHAEPARVVDDSDASFLRRLVSHEARLVSHEALLVRRLDLVRDLIAAYREATDLDDDAPRAYAPHLTGS